MSGRTGLIQAICPHCQTRQLYLRAAVGVSVVCRMDRSRFILHSAESFDAAAWDACGEPGLLRQCLELLGLHPSPRRNVAFALAVARTLYDTQQDRRFRDAVAVAEVMMTTGEISHRFDALYWGLIQTRHWSQLQNWELVALCCLSGGSIRDVSFSGIDAEHPGPVAELMREVVANPFRPPVVRPEWRTGTVRDLAASIDAGREFGTLPVLADAVEEAGCDDRPLLDHLRGPGPHAPGCWALDALLGRD